MKENKRMTQKEKDIVMECISICLKKIEREAGYGGRWEGYGSHMGLMMGNECADAITERFITRGEA